MRIHWLHHRTTGTLLGACRHAIARQNKRKRRERQNVLLHGKISFDSSGSYSPLRPRIIVSKIAYILGPGLLGRLSSQYIGRSPMLDALLATESSMACRILNMSTAGLMIPFSVQRAQHLVSGQLVNFAKRRLICFLYMQISQHADFLSYLGA